LLGQVGFEETQLISAGFFVNIPDNLPKVIASISKIISERQGIQKGLPAKKADSPFEPEQPDAFLQEDSANLPRQAISFFYTVNHDPATTNHPHHF